MGPKAKVVPPTQAEGSTAAPSAAIALSKEPIAVEEGVALETPELGSAEIEEQKRQADLDRLNTMSVHTRREIASMDMMGEFGSKVSNCLCSRSNTDD
jgi:E3 ubiquitin-protein ligase SHPRH